eukprot:TRINITY_DN2172_c3_g1_i2.p1 TRINITY_DN2172_c3_g1~~TRINITY_DN2172_c3_g1_i2.p1  ORF type:complete len:440 (+),score=132.02 TRINITY_DN2172_c3_g1_i2:934-2253(+)
MPSSVIQNTHILYMMSSHDWGSSTNVCNVGTEKDEKFLSDEIDEKIAEARARSSELLCGVEGLDALEEREAAYAEECAAVGIEQAKAALEEAKKCGRDNLRSGMTFEKECVPITWSTIVPRVAAIGWEEVEGRVEDYEVHLLTGVTLGVGQGEIDLLVVRVKSADVERVREAMREEFENGKLKTNNQKQKQKQKRVKGSGGEEEEPCDPWAFDKPCVAVEVLAVIEAKRNPDDIGYAFSTKQSMISWLCGDCTGYDPVVYRNKKYFPTGHFDRAAYHVDKVVGLRYGFTAHSFRFFHRERAIPPLQGGLKDSRERKGEGRKRLEGGDRACDNGVQGDYWRGFFIVARVGGDPTAGGGVQEFGMESGVARKLESRLSEDRNMDLADASYVEYLSAFLRRETESAVLAYEVVNHVAQHGVGDSVVFVTSAVHPQAPLAAGE